jgi:rare lipoprotein A
LLVGVACTPRARREEPRAPHGGAAWREGTASWYGKELAGRKTANGEIFRPELMTAAHRTLRFGTCVAVENLANGKRVQVRVNDRGPYAKSRIIDVSEEAARRLEFRSKGVARVRLSPC